MNASYLMSLAGISELIDFVRSGPSNMHHFRTFPFALARLSCYAILNTFTLYVTSTQSAFKVVTVNKL